MEDNCLYQFQVHGRLDAADLNAMSPVHLAIERCEEDVTLLTARTDQAGMIGLIRHLHGLGLILMGINRVAPE